MRYAEWCTAGPTLEADIAAAAMGLDDIGHSRVLYGCLNEIGAGEAAQADDAYANVPLLDAPFKDWKQFVAANGVLDTAFSLTIEALAAGNVEVLRTRLRKMLQEEQYHFLHGRSWMKEVGGQGALVTAWREAIEFFGPPGSDIDLLHGSGALSMGLTELQARLAERLGYQPQAAEPDWKNWDPIRRRTRPGGIDQATLEMLTGLNEKRYMPASATNAG
jgi:1,2-phenylacetyl-CoA epoxidase catalytic subunit